ncbi:MAG: SDR family NAD(P)-dependent oxidoreductase [Actinomycetota bacterium]|nr:SDR family NAD(P)-dependent oxidoreductase [Actinomycetota bacterium]
MEFLSKICVVTGASSGIGRRTALDLGAAGARVCIAARRRERLTALVDAMGGVAKGHSWVVADVSNRDDVRTLAAHVENRYGRCDILINNAGFANERPFDGPGAVGDLELVMGTNFWGTVSCTAEFLPLLTRSAPSHVVNVASVAGRLALPGASSYCASKFAVVGWSEAVRPELARRGVHLSLVEPGFVPTEGFPQRGLTGHRFLRHTLASDADVSRAIREVIAKDKDERVVPRWYRLFELPRVLIPPLHRWAQGRAAAGTHGLRGP